MAVKDQNPYFTRASVKNRETVGQMLDMVRQLVGETDTVITVKAVTDEKMQLGWQGLLQALRAAAKVVKLQGWANDKGVTPVLAIYPGAMLRYSQGRLSPTDTFGRRVMDICRILNARHNKGGEPTLQETQAMTRAFARARGALEQFSLELASKAGKTGRSYPVLTARMLDWVPAGALHVHPESLEQAGLKEGWQVWAQRHPLPTRVKLTLVSDDRVPQGTGLLNPVDATEGCQMDADGDQLVLIPDWVGSNPEPIAGPTYALEGLPGIESTSLVDWLKPGKLSKLRWDGMFSTDVETFSATVHRLAQYSVTGIGQVGYSPGLCMAVLGLAGVTPFIPVMALGFRRLYEDLMLAGYTPERWALFTTLRDLKSEEKGPLVRILQRLLKANGFEFDEWQVQAYVHARAMASAASSLENGAEMVSTRLSKLMGEYGEHMPLYGLVKAVDAGRIDSIFLPRWEGIVAQYDAELPLVQVLKEICPLMLAARQETDARVQRAEYAA